MDSFKDGHEYHEALMAFNKAHDEKVAFRKMDMDAALDEAHIEKKTNEEIRGFEAEKVAQARKVVEDARDKLSAAIKKSPEVTDAYREYEKALLNFRNPV